MESRALPGRDRHGCDKGRIGEEAAVCNGGVDAGDIHADDAAGAQVEVADLAVAHLSIRETDEVV